MYASDYGFAAAQSAWTTTLRDYDDAAITGANWMYSGVWEWTISRYAGYSNYVFRVDGTGDVHYSYAHSEFGVRPVFSLTSSVNYASGDGTKNSPIRVN